MQIQVDLVVERLSQNNIAINWQIKPGNNDGVNFFLFSFTIIIIVHLDIDAILRNNYVMN